MGWAMGKPARHRVVNSQYHITGRYRRCLTARLTFDVQRKLEQIRLDREDSMHKKLTMVYWKGDKFWLGKFIEYPEIMTQGETIEELEENLRDAYSMMIMEDVPEGYRTKKVSV